MMSEQPVLWTDKICYTFKELFSSLCISHVQDHYTFLSLTSTLPLSTELAVIDLLRAVLTCGELIQVQDVEQLQPLLKSGSAHQPKQLTEAAEAHLASAASVHKLM